MLLRGCQIVCFFGLRVHAWFFLEMMEQLLVASTLIKVLLVPA